MSASPHRGDYQIRFNSGTMGHVWNCRTSSEIDTSIHLWASTKGNSNSLINCRRILANPYKQLKWGLVLWSSCENSFCLVYNRVLPMFCSGSFSASGLIFRILIHLREFFSKVTDLGLFLSSVHGYPVFPVPFVWDAFLQCMLLKSHQIINGHSYVYSCLGLWFFSICVCVFLGKYQIAFVNVVL